MPLRKAVCGSIFRKLWLLSALLETVFQTQKCKHLNIIVLTPYEELTFLICQAGLEGCPVSRKHRGKR